MICANFELCKRYKTNTNPNPNPNPSTPKRTEYDIRARKRERERETACKMLANCGIFHWVFKRQCYAQRVFATRTTHTKCIHSQSFWVHIHKYPYLAVIMFSVEITSNKMLKRTRSKQNNEFRVAEWEHLHGFYPYTVAQDAPHSPYWLWKEDAKKTA